MKAVVSSMVTHVGEVFGLLTVIGDASPSPAGQRRVRVACSCPLKTKKAVQYGNLTSGHTTSCGCVRRERHLAAVTKHGHGRDHKRTPEYMVYHSMIARCYLPATGSYEYYGGKGVKVCDRWRESFEAFLEDVGLRPSPKHVLSRKENDKDFTQDNAAWTLGHDARRNNRNTRLFEINGRTLCLEDWAKEYGIGKSTLHYRLSKGLTMREALDRGRGGQGKVLT